MERLEELKDTLMEEMGASAAIIAENTRERIREACDEIEMDIDYDLSDELDINDLRNEMHEEISDMIRYH